MQGQTIDDSKKFPNPF